MFNINIQKPKSVKFFKDIVTQTLKQRSETGQRRNDMIDMMLDIMNEKDKEEQLEKLKSLSEEARAAVVAGEEEGGGVEVGECGGLHASATDVNKT